MAEKSRQMNITSELVDRIYAHTKGLASIEFILSNLNGFLRENKMRERGESVSLDSFNAQSYGVLHIIIANEKLEIEKKKALIELFVAYGANPDLRGGELRAITPLRLVNSPNGPKNVDEAIELSLTLLKCGATLDINPAQSIIKLIQDPDKEFLNDIFNRNILKEFNDELTARVVDEIGTCALIGYLERRKIRMLLREQ